MTAVEGESPRTAAPDGGTAATDEGRRCSTRSRVCLARTDEVSRIGLFGRDAARQTGRQRVTRGSGPHAQPQPPVALGGCKRLRASANAAVMPTA